MSNLNNERAVEVLTQALIEQGPRADGESITEVLSSNGFELVDKENVPGPKYAEWHIWISFSSQSRKSPIRLYLDEEYMSSFQARNLAAALLAAADEAEREFK